MLVFAIWFGFANARFNFIDFFCSTKHKTPTLNQSSVAYEFVCSGCDVNYVGKTERRKEKFERKVEHA